MKQIATYISALLMTLFVAACSSDTTLDKPDENTESTEPIGFSAPSVGNMETRSTRASSPLTKGFLVSAYKHYGATNQQTVMSQYEALYRSGGWSGSGTSWETVGTTADGFYQTQYTKYWDFSAFPYDFFAITPAPVAGGGVKLGFELSKNRLAVAAAYYSLRAKDGKLYNAVDNNETTEEAAEPYLVAQLERRRKTATQSEDVDMIMKAASGTVNGSLNERVPLPFHHLTSKVRFGIYLAEPLRPSQSGLKIKDVTFTAKTSTGFVTAFDKYEVNLNDNTAGARNTAIDGTFTYSKRATADAELLTFSGPTDTQFTDAYLEKHVKASDTQLNAYYFECEKGMIQIPQNDVQLYVSLTIDNGNGSVLKVQNQRLVVDTNGTKRDQFNWLPNRLYSYYLVMSNPFTDEITFTATVSSWEDIEGKLSVGLED